MRTSRIVGSLINSAGTAPPIEESSIRCQLREFGRALDELEPPRIAHWPMTENDVRGWNLFMEAAGESFRIPWPIPAGFLFRGYELVEATPLVFHPVPGADPDFAWRRFLERK